MSLIRWWGPFRVGSRLHAFEMSGPLPSGKRPKKALCGFKLGRSDVYSPDVPPKDECCKTCYRLIQVWPMPKKKVEDEKCKFCDELRLKFAQERNGLVIGFNDERTKLNNDRLKSFDLLLQKEKEFKEKQTEMQKKVDEMEEALLQQINKNEATHTRYLEATIERDTARGVAAELETRLKTFVKNRVECGFRRAQRDPDYAIIRELLQAGKDIEKVDFMELGKRHPEATLGGMIAVAQELGYRIRIDGKLQEELKKEPTVWRSDWGYGKATMKIMSTVIADAAKASDERLKNGTGP